MPETLTFAVAYEYDTRKPGITVRAELRSGAQMAETVAKVDTGASHSIFQRLHGELIGPKIETGSRLEFSTATGNFIAYGQSVCAWHRDDNHGLLCRAPAVQPQRLRQARLVRPRTIGAGGL